MARTALAVLLMLACLPAALGGTLVDTWMSAYDDIQSITCETHKKTRVGEKTIDVTGMIHFERPDKIHVQESTPHERHVISDGDALYYFNSSELKGVKTPIHDLSDDWKHQLSTVPASPMEHLIRMTGLAEEALPAKEGFPVRKGYRANHLYVVAATDEEGRLTLLEFYRGKDFQQKAAQYVYDDFEEVLPGVWLPLTHRATALAAGQEILETTRFTNVRVNEAIPADVFSVSEQLPGIEFAPPPQAPVSPR